MWKYKIMLVAAVIAALLLLILLPLVFGAVFLVGFVFWRMQRTKVGVPTRTAPAVGESHPEKKDLPVGDLGSSWFIENKVPGAVDAKKEEVMVSCSFIEFDGRGDFLDFYQYRDAYQKVKDLAYAEAGKECSPLLVVIYCHGWKNSAQSGDVLKFNDFLIRLAGSEQMRHRHARVHGVYLGWRGNVFKPHTTEEDLQTGACAQTYEGSILGEAHVRRKKNPWGLLEQLTYWSRKRAAESQVSGVPMARAVFSISNVAKRVGVKEGNRVVVIGHSFGALMLERCLGQASVGLLSSELSWFGDGPVEAAPQAAAKVEAGTTSEAGAARDLVGLNAAEAPAKTEQITGMNANTVASTNTEGETPDGGRAQLKASAGTHALPLDLILFVNSAAPSIYAHMLNGFLQMYRMGLSRDKDKRADAPVVVSVTSTGDAATGAIHPVGNWAVPLSGSMQRWYEKVTKKTNKVPQGYFYSRTPGHNPLLVNHWIRLDSTVQNVPADKALSPDAVLNENLSPKANVADTLSFLTSQRYLTTASRPTRAQVPAASEVPASPEPPPAEAANPDPRHPQRQWVISAQPDKDEQKWREQNGGQPPFPPRSAYWILRCSPEIISDHGDIWNVNAMEMYAAIYRLVLQRRTM